MAVQTRAYLKTRFETNDVPTQQDYADLIDTLISLSSDNSALEYIQILMTDPQKGFSFYTNDNDYLHNLLLHPGLIELKYRNIDETLYTVLKSLRFSVPTRNIGGQYLFVSNGSSAETDGTKSAGIALLKDGTIDIGELYPDTGRFSHMGFKHDYSAKWDALSASVKDRIITDFEYQFNNFLSKLDTADQTVASNVEFEKQVGVSGSESTSSATIAINWTTGTNSREIDITGNISSFTTTEEKAAGNYDAWLVNDGSVRTVVVPTGWDLIPGGDTHDTAANAVNLYQFKVSPRGKKQYIIKNMYS